MSLNQRVTAEFSTCTPSAPPTADLSIQTIQELARICSTLRRLNFYENGPSVNRETNLASIRTRLAPVAPGAICVPVRCGAAI